MSNNASISAQQATANALAERGQFIRFGLFVFYMQPITLAQTWAIADKLQTIDKLLADEDETVVSTILRDPATIEAVSEVVVRVIFRSQWKRKVFGSYIKKRLTFEKLQTVINFMARTLNATFFLESLIFLKGLKKMTSPTATETTALGQ